MGHYDEVLDEARKKGELIANKYIFELYTILRDEENLPPGDCRARIEQDCSDLWSKATIRKFLSEEAKNPKKSKAGKMGAEQKKIKLEEAEKSKSLQIIEQNTDGSATVISSAGARTDLAENDSIGQEKEDSRRFHAELNRQLVARGLSPALLEASRIISEKDSRIKELEDLIAQGNFRQLNSELYLSEKLAREIYNTIRIHGSKGILKTDFILRHDGHNITAVESLDQ